MNLPGCSEALDLRESDSLITTTLLPVPWKHSRFLPSTEQKLAICPLLFLLSLFMRMWLDHFRFMTKL